MSKKVPDVESSDDDKAGPAASSGAGVRSSRRAPKPVKVELDPLAEVPERFMALWQKIADKIIAYFSRAMLLAVGAILVFAVAWGIGQWLDMRREKATELLGKSIQIASAELLREAEKVEEDSDVPRFKTQKERSEAALKSLDALDRDYGGSDASTRGSLVRAGLYYDQARFADAEALYRKFVDSKPSETSLLALGYEGLGLCAEARSDWAAAASAFERQASEPFARERGLWNQARIYAKQGNKQKAIEVYKDLLSKAAAQSPLRDDVQNRLAMLEP